MNFNPRNILVIQFGQLGDVVLSLPALEAVRNRFPEARLTVAAGRAASSVVELSGYADEVLSVDRVALRDGAKPLSVYRIIKLVRDVRRRKFDFIIDLHSLPETNILGFISGAPHRLYAERLTRSLDFLGNFPTRPPRHDFQKHVVERYLDVLAPLGIESTLKAPRLRRRQEDEAAVEALFRKAKLSGKGADDVLLAGIFPGAGHVSRQWQSARFAELADKLERDLSLKIIVFLGPEERSTANEMRRLFGARAVVFDRLTIGQLAAAARRLSVFISNDTGPMHIAAATGTPVVVLIDRPTANGFQPVGEQHQIIYSRTQNINDITVDEVYARTREALAANRTAALFSN